MLRSMTGFGQAEGETDKFTVKVELKSLNSKFFELSLRMPRNWQHKELELPISGHTQTQYKKFAV
jgi:uncharacterized protein YicC (UPF0701 family)